jgi:hypothetical protein
VTAPQNCKLLFGYGPLAPANVGRGWPDNTHEAERQIVAISLTKTEHTRLKVNAVRVGCAMSGRMRRALWAAVTLSD